MVYVWINIAAIVLLAFLTRLLEKNIKSVTSQTGGLVVAVLLLTIEATVFTLTLAFHRMWIDTMTRFMLRFMFFIESLFFISLSSGFITIGANKKPFILTLFKLALAVLGFCVVFFSFKSFELSYSKGVYIGSAYLFQGDAKKFFPWTWLTLYNTVFRVCLPVVGVLIMFILREKQATQLQKYQAVLILEDLVIMWALEYFFKFVSSIVPSFSFLFIWTYIAFFVLLVQTLKTTSVPSGRGIFFNCLRAIISYVVPAVFVGLVFISLAKINKPGFDTYEVLVILASTAAILFSWKVWDWINNGSLMVSNDYESNFEKGLASIDYTGEMDVVTERMFSVFRSNVECSSLGILVDDGKGNLVSAYSSNNSTYSIPTSEAQVFDVLLNVGRNVVIYSEIDDQHDYDNIREPLKLLFENGNFDCMVILNEGHNIVGIITLGKKVSGDHYKDYDKAAFVKLYSYFFVFGYYVRNISNKEVLSTVNRELRMSSQIITSIQENIDHIKSHKADVGYMMVPAHNIGGEFIDLIRLTDTRHLVVIGDLSGKGIAASMNMVILKSIIRTYLAETHDFKKLVAKVNVFVRESLKKGTIFSGLFALIDFETDTMYYINCGVPAMFLYTQVYNNVIEIQGSGHVLGFVKDITPYLSVKTTKLNRGDIILSCTDGLITSHSLRGEKFGRERVSQAVLDNSTYPAQRMAQFTFEGLRKFMSKEMEEDVSIFVLKYKTSAEFATPEEIAAEKKAAEMVSEPTFEEKIREQTENNSEVTSVSESEENSETPSEEVQVTSPVAEEENVFDADLPPEAMAAMAAAQAFAAGGDQFEIPETDEIVAEEKSEADNSEPEKSVDDDFFVEDISSNEKKNDGGEFEFDPSAFGLPDDFTL